LVGYLGRKATGLVDRAARDADVAFDRKVGELYERVRSRLAQRLDPQTVEAVAHGRHEAIQALTNLVANVADEDPEFAAELHQRVKALEASKPPWWCTAVSADRRPVIIGGMSSHARSPHPDDPGTTGHAKDLAALSSDQGRRGG
jgi:hypothetical protein